jgi:hypothetical protein
MLLAYPNCRLDKGFVRQLQRNIDTFLHQPAPEEGVSPISELNVEATEGDLWLLSTTLPPTFGLHSSTHEGFGILIKVYEALGLEEYRQGASAPVPLPNWIEAELQKLQEQKEFYDGNPNKDHPADDPDDFARTEA